MSERNRTPIAHEVLERLKVPESDRELEDVIAIVGYVGPRADDGPLRLFADTESQRFLEFAFEDFVDAEPIPDDERMLIYVKRPVMVENLFTVDAAAILGDLDAVRAGPPLSLWAFIPQNRLTAAAMLGMLPESRHPEDYDEETGA